MLDEQRTAPYFPNILALFPCVLNSQNDHDTIVVHAWDQQLRKEQINDVCYKTDGQIWTLRWYSGHWDRLFLCHFFIAILFVVYTDVKKGVVPTLSGFFLLEF